MSYKLGIRTEGLPVIRWSRVECLTCGEQVWVPGSPPTKGVCVDHAQSATTKSVARYLESITDIK